ncbi:MAG: chromosome segregation protein SMC [Gammaproteobacteria bacterium]|nr:chromosome segregation protein SMC [Gammaproteobacteria bacterium]
MRLSQIKLAGFKSFVDPTTISFPTDRTGVIGPNGCGKSNVIDAVRWVMGESSAKQLRGESMDDVIFNGSSSRPAVSRASIDLIFDNSDHSLGGQYANYNEIAIRRDVTREGQSNYFLNGTRCRRRDIADIFLGTGLGPRSYAIIEQGMISRIIEAKPEELRIYLEEAAGISKYKERRRETENRIRHTRENLDRLDDLRDEVEKQLNHLKRQASAAERYKKYKSKERRLKAELLALRWREMDKQVRVNQVGLDEQQTRVEAVVAEQRAIELKIEQQREAHNEANDQFNAVQAEYYRVGSDISRIEQTIQHYRDTHARQTEDLQQVRDAWQELQQHVENDRAKLENVTQSIADKQPLLESLHKNQQDSSTRLAEAEKAMFAWQQTWEGFNRQQADSEQSVQVEQTRLEQLAEHLQRLQLRLQKLREEQQTLSTSDLETEREHLLQTEGQHSKLLAKQQQQLDETGQSLRNIRTHIDELGGQMDVARNQAQELRGKLVSLEALQQAALGKDKQAVVQWLEKRGLTKQPRLAESLQVENDWERAVETVLGDSLEAVCVNELGNLADVISDLTEGGLMLVERGEPAGGSGGGDRLSDKVQSDLAIDRLLTGVRTCASVSQALALRANLAAGESVITREGLWFGPNWLRVARPAAGQESVLTREQQIKDTRRQLEQTQQRISKLESELETAKQSLSREEQQRDALQSERQQSNDQLAEVKAKLNGISVQLEQVQKRRTELNVELNDIEQQIQRDQAAQSQSQKTLSVAQHAVGQHSQTREQFQKQREQLNQALQDAREHAQKDKDTLHEIALSLESMRSTKSSTDENLARLQQQLQHLQKRRDELEAALAEGDAPVKEMAAELALLLEKRVDIEKRLTDVRKQVESIEETIRQHEAGRVEQEQKVQELRSELEQGRLAAQEARVRCQTINEQLQETDYEREQLFAEMPEEAGIESWHEQVEKLEQRIDRMGPINLAAIDEHREQAERKEYLDRQNSDLTEALATLESAIAKIDKETRSRFKEIFERVNSSLHDMFPRLFGGGEAHMEMTGNDLLSTGVAIMARPPGKRISNIHLLSGGEKALTAVAMVFAIFQLNPAPFCLLDEVDAPLDEANVERFNDLVKEMSDKVQFICITHNKTTMEMVDQLIGVTMREAGVSRIVAVDVEEAIKMATA